MSLINEAKNLQEILVKNRRYFHENAETHNNLPKTTKYVMEKLTEMGYEPKEICQSGVIALAGGKKPGKVILLRGDMDALPIVEETDLEFKSENGSMHACGHDFHTSMLLGAAKLLKDHEDEIEGTVKFMFQPAEETLSGAKAMIEAGILENPKVDVAMMIHVFGGMPMPSGTVIMFDEEICMASADWFEITIKGKGCHGAMPNSGIDPLNIASHIHIALQELNAREIAPGEKIALTIGQMHGGNTSNVVPDTAFMSGTIRTINNETRAFLKKRLEEICTGIATTFRAEVDVVYTNGCPCLYNNPGLKAEIMKYSEELFGEDKIFDMSKSKTDSAFGSEDFAFVSEVVPSVVLGLGAGCPDEGYIYPQHHPKIKFNEDILHLGAALYANTALSWLKNNK